MSTDIQPIVTELKDKLKVRVYNSRDDMGRAAAANTAARMKQLLKEKDRIRMVFAAAPSQNEFLQALTEDQQLDWSRVTAFHMDEYIGLPEDAPQRFSQFLKEKLFDKVNPGELHLIQSSNGAEEECRRYTELLNEAPIDIVCLGIGENGHIAFNDPPVANFEDPEVMKPVELDDACRRQQVNDGCFPSFDDVPTHALTLTIPTMLSASHLFCIVPGAAKREAVMHTLNGPITTQCPASILRTHPDCTLYLDPDSYGDVS
ncbi:glucosamine-6-phosphate deaminase [Paenibacillus senegalensis]|uniref:glucosamine-6-phosphate deaminase n=1 Tax=Paenibacillus senegalensis TaxID=1465766 RepID=UPI000288EB48|nr:glucosamine-6-phosphate deaminase [Paenibacillus senegalensis]